MPPNQKCASQPEIFLPTKDLPNNQRCVSQPKRVPPNQRLASNQIPFWYMPSNLNLTHAHTFLHFYAESAETTWKHEDIMCEDPGALSVIDDRKDNIFELFLPVFNFSLIVDPNDPLFEDEIKASNRNMQKSHSSKFKV